MPEITYIQHDGVERVVDVPEGRSVMEGGRDAGVDGIVAECGGACSCSTCHVYVDEAWIARLPSMESMEEDMIEFAPGMDPKCSRLSCQLRVTAGMHGLTVRVPEEQA